MTLLPILIIIGIIVKFLGDIFKPRGGAKGYKGRGYNGRY